MILFMVHFSRLLLVWNEEVGEREDAPAVQLFLGWALNEACRIFNLVAEERQGELKIILEQGAGL